MNDVSQYGEDLMVSYFSCSRDGKNWDRMDNIVQDH